MFLLEVPNFSDPAIWISLLTLTFLEIVLGIDNIIFISIISDKLDPAQQKKARNIGLLLAMVFRVCLLLTITWIMRLTEPVVTIPFMDGEDGLPLGLSWKDLILIVGGLFLVYKSTTEIHHKLEKPTPKEETKKKVYASLSSVIMQIVLVDAVFSFDSILTAVGLVDYVSIMIIAVVISIIIMMIFAGTISRFINNNPSLQMLALAFLIVIGVMLVAEGFHQHISKSYIYTMIAFSLLVEVLNMRFRKNREKVDLSTRNNDIV